MKLQHVLLVEDDEMDIELTLMALAELNLANKVEVVRDGEEALDFLFRRGKYKDRNPGNPVVVVLDLKMPRVSGLEVLKQIRADEQLRSTPVVVLTSSRQERDILDSYNLGVNAYVVKPVNFKEFVASVKQLGLFWGVMNEPPPDRNDTKMT